MWAGPLGCLSLPSVRSWIRPDTSIWKLALSQSCSPRIKEGRKRVKCLLRSSMLNEIDVQYEPSYHGWTTGQPYLLNIFIFEYPFISDLCGNMLEKGRMKEQFYGLFYGIKNGIQFSHARHVPKFLNVNSNWLLTVFYVRNFLGSFAYYIKHSLSICSKYYMTNKSFWQMDKRIL